MKKIFTLVLLCVFISIGGLYSIGSFNDNGDGTITDTASGLMWTKCGLPYPDCSYDPVTRTWLEAVNDCETLNFASYQDWRLPNINELFSIVDIRKTNPAIDTVFFQRNTDHFWSSTTSFGDSTLAMRIEISNYGGSGTYLKSLKLNVRCVRTTTP